MNKKLIYSLAISAAALAPFGLLADPATPDPLQSQVEARLNVDVSKDTKEVHFISTNNDPDILTKVYVLKNADPYEIRPYVRSAIQAERVTGGGAKIETIKYNDGTGMLIVSAEDYRFGKQENGMGIDEIVAQLDQPNLTSSSGTSSYLYFPKYWDAQSLQTVLINSGLNVANDSLELTGGKDKALVDPNLNAILMYVPAYSIKGINKILQDYDTPTSEANVKYTIYELNSENDAQLGTDFQAWKNGPGSDLFAAGARYANGWDLANMAPSSRPYVHNSRTRYFQFNPKWNTRYLDFLAADGKAKIITTGSLTIMNNTQGYIENTTRLPAVQDGEPIASTASINDYQRLNDAAWDDGNGTAITTAAAPRANVWRIDGAVDEHGEPIVIQRPGAAAVNANIDFLITRSTVGSETYYFMRIGSDADAWFYSTTGKNLGKSVRCWDVTLQRRIATLADAATRTYTYAWVDQTNWLTDRNMTIAKDVTRVSAVNEYGFQLTMTPVVCENATTLNVEMVNTSLIGFRDNGLPRTSRSEVSTRVMVSNSGQRFVIGGLDKKALIKSTAKLPFLGDLPGFGWILGGEAGIIKKTQLVAVVECTPVMPDTAVPAAIAQQIEEATKKIDDAGIKDSEGNVMEVDYGFDQLLLDSEKKGIDPLP